MTAWGRKMAQVKTNGQELKITSASDPYIQRLAGRMNKNKNKNIIPIVSNSILIGSLIDWTTISNSQLSSNDDSPPLGSIVEHFREQEPPSTEEIIAAYWAEQNQYPLDGIRNIAYVAQHNRALFYAMEPTIQLSSEDNYREILRDFLKIQASEAGVSKDLLATLTQDKQLTIATLQHSLIDEGQSQQLLRALARLKLPIYITTGYHDGIQRAIVAESKGQIIPRTVVITMTEEGEGSLGELEVHEWKPGESEPTIAQPPLDLLEKSDSTQPVVIHLYGHELVTDSLILGEDDYFEYLIRVTQPQVEALEEILAAMAPNPIIMLGYRIQDWDFKILHYWLRRCRNVQQDKQNSNISGALLLNPKEVEGLDIDQIQIRHYLERLLDSSDVKAVWRQNLDFVQGLLDALNNPGRAPQKVHSR